MDESIRAYYCNQAGSGISGFEGSQYQYQKGKGFFGRLLKGIAMPIFKYFGRKALATGTDIATDVLKGENFKRSGKKRLREAMETVTGDAKRKLLDMTQSGSGLKKSKGRGRKRNRLSKIKRIKRKYKKKTLQKKKSIKRRKSRKASKKSSKKSKYF